RDRGQHDDRNVASARGLLELGRSSPAIKTRHGQIHHDYVWFLALCQLDADQAVTRRVNLTAHHGQVVPIDEPGIEVIVHHQDDGPLNGCQTLLFYLVEIAPEPAAFPAGFSRYSQQLPSRE